MPTKSTTTQHKKEQAIDTFNNIDESQLHYAKRKNCYSNNYMIPFICHSGKGTTIALENKLVVSRG